MATVKLETTKLLSETKRLAKQQAAARGVFLYEHLRTLVNEYKRTQEVIKFMASEDPIVQDEHGHFSCYYCGEEGTFAHAENCPYISAVMLNV